MLKFGMGKKWAMWISVFLCQACTDGATTGDAQNDIADSATPALVKYRLNVAGPLDDFVEIVIDGEPRDRHTQYLVQEDYLLSSTRIESRHKVSGNVLSSADIRPVCAPDSSLPPGVIETESQTVCVSPNGYISGLSDTCCSGSGNVPGCIDTFCPQCSPLDTSSCSTDKHCGLVLAHEDPLIVHASCLTPGTIELGESCSFAAAGPDGVDDCVAGAACIDNTCREFCSRAENECGNGSTCVGSEFLSSVSNLGVCLPENP